MRTQENQNNGRIAQEEQNLIRMNRICKSFQKFYQDFPYEDLIKIYNDSIVDYLCYIEVASTPDRYTIVNELWDFHHFHQFVQQYLIVNTMCSNLSKLHRAKKTCANYYSELFSEIRELKRKVKPECVTVMSDAFEAWSRQDETISLVEYEDGQSTFLEFKAWFNRLTEWLEEFENNEKEVSNA